MENVSEILREKVNESAVMYGTSHPRTIELSQKLDRYMVLEQRKCYGNN